MKRKRSPRAEWWRRAWHATQRRAMLILLAAGMAGIAHTLDVLPALTLVSPIAMLGSQPDTNAPGLPGEVTGRPWQDVLSQLADSADESLTRAGEPFTPPAMR